MYIFNYLSESVLNQSRKLLTVHVFCVLFRDYLSCAWVTQEGKFFGEYFEIRIKMFELSNNFDEEFNTIPREGVYGITFVHEVRNFRFISTY